MSVVTFLALNLYLLMDALGRFLRRRRYWRAAMTVELWTDRLFTIETNTLRSGGNL